MKNIPTLIVSLCIILFTLTSATVGHTDPDSVGTIPLTDDILRSKAAFAVVDEEIAHHLNLSLLSEWDYQKLHGPVLWKIRAPIHFHLREQFGKIVDTVDFSLQQEPGSPSQNPSISRGNEPPRLHRRAAEIIRDFINQEQISVIIRSNTPIGIGETAAIRRLRGEVRYTYDIINGACVVIPIKNLAALINRPFVTEIWPDGKGNLELNDSIPQIGANKPHSLGVTGEGIRVAVVDGGVDSTHSEFQGRIIDRRLRRLPTLRNRDHGTHVAGIIGAADDGRDVTGVAPKVELLDAEISILRRINNIFGEGEANYGEVIDAINWAAKKNKNLNAKEKADVINMSLGWEVWDYGQDGSDPMSLLVNQVVSDGVVFVKSAGNAGKRRVSGIIEPALNPIKFVGFKTYSFFKSADDVEIYLLWYTEANNLDLAILDANAVREITSSRTPTTAQHKTASGAFYEQVTLQNTNGGQYMIRVEADFSKDNFQHYEVWVGKKAEFVDPDPDKTITIPGYSEKIITVGAVDKLNNGTEYSSRGPTNIGLMKPEIVAPGGSRSGKIRSTVASYLGDIYDELLGTSMAAPHVAGVAALILDAVGKNDRGEWNFNPDEVKSAIVRGAEGLSNTPNNTYGAGLVKADNIIFGNMVPANGKLRFEIKPRLYDFNFGRYRLNADPYLVAAISWENPAHNLDLVLSDAANGRTLPMVSQTASTSAKIGGNEFIVPTPGTTYFLEVINRSQESVLFTGAATHKIEETSTPTQIQPPTISRQNQPPMTSGSITAQTLTVGDSPKTVDVSNAFQDPEGQRLTYTVESTDRNVAVANVPRLTSQVTITPKGQGIATVIVTAEDPGGLTTVQTIVVKVESSARACTYALSKRSQEIPAVGGLLWVDVTTHANCTWTARSNSGFLSLTPRNGTGSGTVRVTVSANSNNSARTGTLTIAGQTFTVEQVGELKPASQDLSIGDGVVVQNAGTIGVNVRSATQVVDWSRLGKVYDGATGIIRQGPRTADGFTWWKVEWDRSAKVVWNGGFAPLDNQAWSVESTNHGIHLVRRPPDLEVRSFEVSDNTVTPGEEFTLETKIRNNGPGDSPATKIYFYHSSTGSFSADDDLGIAGTAEVPVLSPRTSRTLKTTVKAPLTPDRYYYGVFIDQNTQGETDPDNLRNNYADEKRITVQQTVQQPQPTAVSIYWTDWDTNKIQRANFNGTNIQDLVTTGLGSPYGIALDVAGSKMYWTDAGTAKIQRANLDGSNVQDLVPLGLSAPICIALDVDRGKMYWTDRGTGKIQRANLDGSNIQDLVFGVRGLHGLALDIAAGKMYWTDNGVGQIQRANLDGTRVENLITTGLHLPNEIALDVVGGKMYWTDDGTRKIQRANLDGSNVQDLVSNRLHLPVGITLDIAGGKMYWTDLGTRKIHRANLNGSNVQDLVSTGLNAPFGIALGTALTFSPPVVVREDVNNDGIVDIHDVLFVDQNELDLNGDGVSDIEDILLVVEAMNNANAAPAVRTQALHLLTAERVQQWIVDATLLRRDHHAYQRAMLILEQLLALLIPKETALLPNYPNPFNPETWIPYQIAEPADVTLHIYAANGHLVRKLVLGHQQAGMYHSRSRAVYWDGRNQLGEPVASGIYFYTLSAGNFMATRKMLIRK